MRRSRGGNEFFEGSSFSGTVGRRDGDGSRRPEISLSHLLPSSSSLLNFSPSSFRHTSAPPLFQPLRPRFFMRLFARAFRHLTPVVSRHRRGCPTEPLRTSCGDIGGMRERRLVHLCLWSVLPLSTPPFLLNLSFVGSNIAEGFAMQRRRGSIRWRRHELN